MNNYVSFLRQYIGTKPILFCGAGVIIVNDKRELLMIHRVDNDTWAIPGGSLELGEKVEEAAARELFEETGLKVKKLELLNVYSGKEMYYKYPNGDEVYYIGTVFIGRECTGEMKPDGVETKDIRYFPLDSLPVNLNPPDRVVLDDFLKNHTNRI